MSPQLSVVIATYNRGPQLLDLLRDLGAQDLDPAQFEVVVVDDGSTTPVGPAIAALDLPYPVAVLSQTNTGAAGARDRGIRQAQGSVIVITDDDMRVESDFLSEHLRLHQAGYTVVMGQINAAAGLRDMPLFERFHAHQLAHYVTQLHRGKATVLGVRLCTGNVSVRRRDYLAVGGFDPALQRSEDRDLGLRLERSGANMTFSQRACVVHNSNHTSLATWMGRAFAYGQCDTRIADKYPDMETASPWRLFYRVNPLQRPLLLGAVAFPRLARLATRAGIKASLRLDGLGLHDIAIAGTTLTFCMEYFRGLRREAGSLRQATHAFLHHRRIRRRGHAPG